VISKPFKPALFGSPKDPSLPSYWSVATLSEFLGLATTHSASKRLSPESGILKISD